MHVIAFGLKRAFQATLRIARQPFAAFGITPARFDMLVAVSRGYQSSLPQRALGEWLGVTAATISRMLRSLEELGLVTRERSTTDRRQLIVRVTARAQSILRRVFASVARSADLAFDCVLTDGRPWDDSACLLETTEAESILHRVRSGFGDVARLYYAWHPDD